MFMASPIRSRDAKRAAGAPRGDGRAIPEALPRTDAEGSLAATLPCCLLPLRLAASLRPGLGQSEAARRSGRRQQGRDRKSTRLNSSHDQISYAVFCLKKKKKNK